MASVVAQSHFIFGLRAGVKNNLCFVDEQTVVYPGGNTCVCYNTVQRCQRLIPASEKSRCMHALAISANRRYLAMSESGEEATITVFDLQHEQGRKRKVLTAGDLAVQEFVCMAFSPDSKYLIGQTGGPEWTLVLWFWEKQEVLATVKTGTPTNPVSQVSFNPYNNMQLCVSGNGVFKLLRYSAGALRQSSSPKVESINFLCHTWMSAERVIAGTDASRLLVFESGKLRREINTATKTDHDRSDRQVDIKMIQDAHVDESADDHHVTAIVSYSKGFVCSVGPGTVCLFEKQHKEDGYRRSREIQIRSDPNSSELSPGEYHRIDTMCISPAEETLVISTAGGQLYCFDLSSVDLKKEEYFEFLSQSFHSKSITGLSVCVRKPLIATSSLDQSVRIWNYETKVLELCKEFQEEAFSVALHPTGLLILVGFSDKLRLMNLFIDDIRSFKEFTVRRCRECAFSHGGHMFAAVNGDVIQIYSVLSFENIINLKGHNGEVHSIKWSPDDSQLVSCGADGAVYEWNIRTGKRESESVIKSCSYTDVAFSSDCKTILGVGTDFTLKEIQDCQVLREVPGDDVAHTAMAVSQSGRAIFTGTSSGTVRAVKYPLPIQKEWITYQAHCRPVTKMVITYDEKFLLTASEDGCLLIWKIMNKEGHGLRSNREIIHTEEILAVKSDLEEKRQNMQKLRMRLEELQMENEYQLRLKDINCNEKMKEISDAFNQQIESLKTVQQAMITKMEKQGMEHGEISAEAAVNHSKHLEDLELSYSKKLIVEHERYQDLQMKYERMLEDNDKQLKAAEENRVQALEEMMQKYEAKLKNTTRLHSQCQEESQQQLHDYKEMIRQVEENEEKMIHNLQIKYETKLHTEKETNRNLRGGSDAMTQQVKSLRKQIDEKSTEINKMTHEQQRLTGLTHLLEGDIKELKRRICGHERTNQDKDTTISNLKKKIQEHEKMKFVLDEHSDHLKQQTEPQLEEIKEKTQQIQRMEEELLKAGRSNSELKLNVSQLKLSMKTREREMHREMQKGKDSETLLQRIRSDLHDSVGFIQEPKKLKQSVKAMYARYVPQPDQVEKRVVDEDLQKVFLSHRDHYEKTISSLKTRMVRSDEDHDRAYVKIVKDNLSLVTENNELRRELDLTRTQVKDYKAQLAEIEMSNKSRPGSGRIPDQ